MSRSDKYASYRILGLAPLPAEPLGSAFICEGVDSPSDVLLVLTLGFGRFDETLRVHVKIRSEGMGTDGPAPVDSGSRKGRAPVGDAWLEEGLVENSMPWKCRKV